MLTGNVTFILLSFEGPDPYSLAGGLGVRMTHLAETLARRGFDSHLLFVGDPLAAGREIRENGRLTLHRWCQWISARYPDGVYAGEEEKLSDFNFSAPPFILQELIRPAVQNGRIAVVLAEEWHTAEAINRLHDQLVAAGLRDRVVIFWNANNTMSFHRVDWPRLNHAAQLTTVSRYMKHLMWEMGLNPLVIPNGIPGHLLHPVDSQIVGRLRQTLAEDPSTVFLFKVGRFDPAKRWIMAVESAAQLKAQGYSVAFPLRGGIEPHGGEVFHLAAQLGLSVANITRQPDSWDQLLADLRDRPADIYNIRFFMNQELLRPFYAAADAVLANSGHEPFGLVGLEAMAVGGVVFTGATGEEYATTGQCAAVLDTDSPAEITSQILTLKEDPARVLAIRQAARLRAADFTWEKISDILLDKIEFAAQISSILPRQTNQNGRRAATAPVEDVLIYTVIHQPRRLRLPAAELPAGADPSTIADLLFDEPLNEHYFRKVAESCYYPAIAQFRALLDKGLKLSIGLSLSFVRQAQTWDLPLLRQLQELIRHERVELIAVEPTHSFILLLDVARFMDQMRFAADELEAVFGVRPVVADTTELMMSDTIYHALDLVGFQGAFVDGRPWVLEWRDPTHIYHHGPGEMKLLARHYQLSDDVGYRFSDRSWNRWPLMADCYARWLARTPGELVVIGWDFETFGEHHRLESGIFGFLQALPHEVQQAGLSFVTASEAIAKHGRHSYDLPLSPFASTWAGSGGLDFFLGNQAQQSVFQLMQQAYQKACLTQDAAWIDLALWLAQSDNLHLIQWYGRSGSEAEVSAYFTPKEWWQLGGERIIWEIQQVYKNFIAALDPFMLASHIPLPDHTLLHSHQ